MIRADVKKIFFVVALMHAVVCSASHEQVRPEQINIAILGLGGRCHMLLEECLKLKARVGKEIRVAAVCDDSGAESLRSYLDRLARKNNPLHDEYAAMFKDVAFYPDNKEGLDSLFANHKNLDQTWVTSPNYSHKKHIDVAIKDSSCKRFFLEKPLFKTLDEFTDFSSYVNGADITVGLTLRYSTMAKIVVQKLQEYQDRLGSLQKVRAWERLRFGHMLTAFMMGWRRYVSLSGGGLSEKAIHDVDLSLFFINSLGLDFTQFSVRTHAAHNFYRQSRKDEIISKVLADERLTEYAQKWDKRLWKRLIDFVKDEQGEIDWAATLEAVFKDIPQDDVFDGSDLIPDYYNVNAQIQTAQGNTIDYEVEVDFGGYRTKAERGMHFVFEHGRVDIDMMGSVLSIVLDNGDSAEFDLQTNHRDHADGDEYVAHTLLGTLPDGQHKAMFADPMVQISSLIGFIAEHQVLHNNTQLTYIKKNGDGWVWA